MMNEYRNRNCPGCWKSWFITPPIRHTKKINGKHYPTSYIQCVNCKGLFYEPKENGNGKVVIDSCLKQGE